MVYESFFTLQLLAMTYGYFSGFDYELTSWYMCAMMSLTVMWVDDVHFSYEVEYLSASVQPYDHMRELMICIIGYLGVDLVMNPSNKIDAVAHHVESIGGLSLALYGRSVGILNNCIRNEFSTIFLALGTICGKSKNKFLKKVAPVFMLFFIPTFVWYRIIPCTIMTFVVFSNLSTFINDNIGVLHLLFYCTHVTLQYYWMSLIMRKVIRMVIPRDTIKVNIDS